MKDGRIHPVPSFQQDVSSYNSLSPARFHRSRNEGAIIYESISVYAGGGGGGRMPPPPPAYTVKYTIYIIAPSFLLLWNILTLGRGTPIQRTRAHVLQHQSPVNPVNPVTSRPPVTSQPSHQSAPSHQSPVGPVTSHQSPVTSQNALKTVPVFICSNCEKKY